MPEKENKSLKEQVPARCWYYLLDFNEQDNFSTILKECNTGQIRDLSLHQFWKLFYIATKQDLKLKHD